MKLSLESDAVAMSKTILTDGFRKIQWLVCNTDQYTEDTEASLFVEPVSLKKNVNLDRSENGVLPVSPKRQFPGWFFETETNF